MTTGIRAQPPGHYRPPTWLRGGHLQTIWAARLSRLPSALPPWQRECWSTPDGDSIEVDRLEPTVAHAHTPQLVLFHGLEGNSASPYALAFARTALDRGWAIALPHFRGCGGEINRAPRAYHSGDHAEIDWILRRFRQQHPQRDLVAAGVSLGGNALLRWAGEHGQTANAVVRAVAAVCSPLDLMASGQALGRGLNRWVYTPMFLKTMKPKALQKWAQYPGLFDRDAMLAAQDLYTFDNVFTAPVHGFRDTEHYWTEASAKRHLGQVRVPALALNARNDPFVPEASLPGPADISAAVTLWQPPEGGHVGFPVAAGRPGWHTAIDWMPQAVCTWLAQHLEVARG